MTRIFKRAKHLWNAKGRHGTHSPFVYAFVEQVMRDKTKFRLSGPGLVPGNLSGKERNQLGRILLHLNPEIVYVDHLLHPVLKALMEDNETLQFQVESIHNNENGFKKGGLFLCSPVKEIIEEFIGFFLENHCAAVIARIHSGKAAYDSWDFLSSSEFAKMVLDTWHFGFVSNHPDFKIKQYFRLR